MVSLGREVDWGHVGMGTGQIRSGRKGQRERGQRKMARTGIFRG